MDHNPDCEYTLNKPKNQPQIKRALITFYRLAQANAVN